MIARGLAMLPTGIAPITPGWGQRRVLQRQTELAVYAFPSDVDLESELVLVYGFDQTSSWSGILPRIQRRAGPSPGPCKRGALIETGQASTPYREIFR